MSVDDKVIGTSREVCPCVKYSKIITTIYGDGRTIHRKCTRGTNNPVYFYSNCKEDVARWCKG